MDDRPARATRLDRSAGSPSPPVLWSRSTPTATCPTSSSRERVAHRPATGRRLLLWRHGRRTDQAAADRPPPGARHRSPTGSSRPSCGRTGRPHRRAFDWTAVRPGRGDEPSEPARRPVPAGQLRAHRALRPAAPGHRRSTDWTPTPSGQPTDAGRARSGQPLSWPATGPSTASTVAVSRRPRCRACGPPRAICGTPDVVVGENIALVVQDRTMSAASGDRGSGPHRRPYLEYGGLTSVPGPFRCSQAAIVPTPVTADPDRWRRSAPPRWRTPTARSSVRAGSGRSSCSPSAPWPSGRRVRTAPRSSTSPTTRHGVLDRAPRRLLGADGRHAPGPPRRGPSTGSSCSSPVMCVDNPISLSAAATSTASTSSGARPVVTARAAPGCTLEVFGGDFGRAGESACSSCSRSPPDAMSHPVEALAGHGRRGRRAGPWPEPRPPAPGGGRRSPAGDFVHQVASALRSRVCAQVTARQFRIPTGDGAGGSTGGARRNSPRRSTPRRRTS